MARLFVISDNTDTLSGLRLAGVSGALVRSAGEAEDCLSALLKADGGEYRMILYTPEVRRMAGPALDRWADRMPGVLFYEIPDRHGYREDSPASAEMLKRKLGIGSEGAESTPPNGKNG